MSAGNPEDPDLVINARRLARSFGEPFDPVHIVAVLLIGLLRDGAAGPAGAVILANTTKAQRDQWLQVLQDAFRGAVVRGDAQPAYGQGQNQGPTKRLMDREGEWLKAAAAEYGGKVTDLLVLLTVLSSDPLIIETARTCGIDRSALLQQLRTQLGPANVANAGWGSAANAPGWGGQPNAGGWGNAANAGQDPYDRFDGPGGWSTGPIAAMTPQEQAAAAQARRLTLPARYTPGLGYRAMFLSDMIEFLGQLNTSTRGIDLFVLSGMNGSPATRFGEVLAGRLAMGERFDGQHPALAGYRGVMTIDVRPLVSTALPGGADASRVLAMALDVAASAHSILMVDHIEALDGTESPRPELWNVLLSRGQAVAFGVYWTATDADPHLQRRPGTPLVPKHTPASTPQETSNLINQVYAPYWASQFGVIVPADIPGVFADIYALERGAHVRGQRITLPFLAVEVADNAIQRARNGGIAAVADTTAGALAEIGRLRADKDVPEANKGPFAHALKEAERAILALGKPPKLHIDQNNMIRLTRAQVTAQLIDVNESYFAYPQP